MGLKVLVDGTAICIKHGNPEIRPFDEEFILEDESISEAEARSIIQNGLITDRMKKKLAEDGFKRVRECQVISIDKTSAKSDNAELTKLLSEATKLQCIPDNLNMYSAEGAKEKALKKAIATAKARNTRAKKKAAKESVQDLGYVED